LFLSDIDIFINTRSDNKTVSRNCCIRVPLVPHSRPEARWNARSIDQLSPEHPLQLWWDTCSAGLSVPPA